MAGEFQQRALVHDFNVQRFARGMNGPAPHLIIKKHQSNGHTNTPSNTQPAAFSFSHSFMDVSRGRARDGRNHHAAPHACRHITRGVAAVRSSPIAHQEVAWPKATSPPGQADLAPSASRNGVPRPWARWGCGPCPHPCLGCRWAKRAPRSTRTFGPRERGPMSRWDGACMPWPKRQR